MNVCTWKELEAKTINIHKLTNIFIDMVLEAKEEKKEKLERATQNMPITIAELRRLHYEKATTIS